jgi:putative ABC transport system permease protein
VLRQFRAFFTRLRSFFANERQDRDFSDEMETHLRLHIADNLRAGMTPQQAQREALMKLGGIEQTKQLYRERQSLPWLETLLEDVRFGSRMLRKNPGFTAIAVLTMALGIGANTAIFSVINSVLLGSLPYKDAHELVLVWESDATRGKFRNVVSPPDFTDWQRQNDVFSGMSAIADVRRNFTGSGEPEQVVVQYVSVNFFTVLGVAPLHGPGFRSENGETGKDDVVILSNAFWKQHFSADPSVVGRTLTVNGRSQTVVGIAPENFGFFIKNGSLTSGKPQMWSPFVFPKAFTERKDIGRFLTVVARLKSGVTRDRAQNEMSAVAARIAQSDPEHNKNWGANVVPLREQLSGDLRPALLVLFGAVAFVLLIACANVSSLLLARAAAREREVAIRIALGAGRRRVARQLLTESVLLAVAGGILGAILALWGTNALLAASPKNLLDLRSVTVDPRLLAFAAALSILSGLLFGFLPSYFSANATVSETLKEGTRSATAGRHRRLVRSGFVVAQMALALVLLAGSALLFRSFIRLAGVAPGFDTNNLLTFTVALPASNYPKDPAVLSFYQRLLSEIRQLPGVSSVSIDSAPPFSGSGAATGVHILGQPDRPLSELPVAAVRIVGPAYFETMGIPLRRGRTFLSEELTEERHVVIVNQAFVDHYLPGENPLGRKVAIFMKSLEESTLEPSEIIGVAGDVHLASLNASSEPLVYWPHPELVNNRMTALVRTAIPPLSLVSSLRSTLKRLDSELPMSNIATMDDLLSDSLSRARFTMRILGIFAAVALLLAAVGIYGVIAFGVTQRTQEIGIRAALGAQPRDVLRMVLREGLRLTLAGVVLGIVGALVATRLLAGLLYEIAATDPLTFAGVALLLTIVALAACYIPARRATRVDPLVALRYE